MKAQQNIVLLATVISLALPVSAQSVDDWATETLLDESHIADDPNFSIYQSPSHHQNPQAQFYPNHVYQEQTSYMMSGQMAPLQGTAQSYQQAQQWAPQMVPAQNYAGQMHNGYPQQAHNGYAQNSYQQNPYPMYSPSQNQQPIVIIQQMPAAPAAAAAATTAGAPATPAAAAPAAKTATAANPEKQPAWKGLLNSVTTNGAALPGNFGKGMSAAAPLLDAVLQRF